MHVYGTHYTTLQNVAAELDELMAEQPTSDQDVDSNDFEAKDEGEAEGGGEGEGEGADEESEGEESKQSESEPQSSITQDSTPPDQQFLDECLP